MILDTTPPSSGRRRAKINRNRGSVYDYFEIREDGTWKCKLCEKTGRNLTSTNAKSHFEHGCKSQDKPVWDDLKQQDEQKKLAPKFKRPKLEEEEGLASFSPTTSATQTPHPRQDLIWARLALLIAKPNFSIWTLLSPEFIGLIDAIDPTVKVSALFTTQKLSSKTQKYF